MHTEFHGRFFGRVFGLKNPLLWNCDPTIPCVCFSGDFFELGPKPYQLGCRYFTDLGVSVISVV